MFYLPIRRSVRVAEGLKPVFSWFCTRWLSKSWLCLLSQISYFPWFFSFFFKKKDASISVCFACLQVLHSTRFVMHRWSVIPLLSKLKRKRPLDFPLTFFTKTVMEQAILHSPHILLRALVNQNLMIVLTVPVNPQHKTCWFRLPITLCHYSSGCHDLAHSSYARSTTLDELKFMFEVLWKVNVSTRSAATKLAIDWYVATSHNCGGTCEDAPPDANLASKQATASIVPAPGYGAYCDKLCYSARAPALLKSELMLI